MAEVKITTFNVKGLNSPQKRGQQHTDDEGRLLILKGEIASQKYTLANLYAPNKATVQWLLKALEIIKHFAEGQVILGADLNLVLNPELDSSTAKSHIAQKHISQPEIGNITISDHAPCHVTLASLPRREWNWKLNESLLNNRLHIEQQPHARLKVNGTLSPTFEITNDTENCQRCPDHEWPNESKNKCVVRDDEFFSYETDVLALVFSIISTLLSLITFFIIGIFSLFQKSPIVRANNQNLSFILLTSLMFSLLCVFLFIGRPVDITCRLRQICFGIFFTVAVSSVLAKTIIVCIAFKATRPDSSWRKCVGVKLPYSVVLVCSSIQVLNAVIWLSVSPPYQELNLDYPGKIILQCNEGSILAFYFMLGYMGFLAALSFVLAFMVRTLPDIYNEAKFITFSMLVFCSVWICAIPAYLSSTGKHMVIVEIFAILSSGVFDVFYQLACKEEIWQLAMSDV
ncbi:vomeronasal type-2 receptor 26-like [Bufo bufo]|uniref:vomeronasal type-2 receptor 26-like n=1 Tax=Bufo bufo TaxID=8384 RepID=UPI001ABEE576|nr:vomeronasal type-2 receptor 26-like [Bufo bufo]